MRLEYKWWIKTESAKYPQGQKVTCYQLALFHFCVLLSAQTEEQKKKQGRPGNKARSEVTT